SWSGLSSQRRNSYFCAENISATRSAAADADTPERVAATIANRIRIARLAFPPGQAKPEIAEEKGRRVPSCRRRLLSPRPVGVRDAEEVGGLEAGAADQGAVDVVDRKQLARIGRFHRAAVEDAHAVGLGADQRLE